jgi:hypothetical protein
MTPPEAVTLIIQHLIIKIQTSEFQNVQIATISKSAFVDIHTLPSKCNSSPSSLLSSQPSPLYQTEVHISYKSYTQLTTRSSGISSRWMRRGHHRWQRTKLPSWEPECVRSFRWQDIHLLWRHRSRLQTLSFCKMVQSWKQEFQDLAFRSFFCLYILKRYSTRCRIPIEPW